MGFVTNDGIYHDGNLPTTGLAGALAPAFGTEATAQPGTYDASGNYVPLTMGKGKAAAANTTAAILRGNYENWKSTYFPKLQQMIGETTYNDPSIVGEETAKASGQVASAFNTARTGAQNTMARYGLSVDQSTNDATDLAQVAATVGTQNQTRQYLADRDRSILAGTPRAVATTT